MTPAETPAHRPVTGDVEELQLSGNLRDLTNRSLQPATDIAAEVVAR